MLCNLDNFLIKKIYTLEKKGELLGFVLKSLKIKVAPCLVRYVRDQQL